MAGALVAILPYTPCYPISNTLAECTLDEIDIEQRSDYCCTLYIWIGLTLTALVFGLLVLARGSLCVSLVGVVFLTVAHGGKGASP